jgi:hypothetical protein
MPAVSKAQRRYLAMQEHMPAQQRKVHMSKQKFDEFTKTSEKGLPEHKSKGKKKK